MANVFAGNWVRRLTLTVAITLAISFFLACLVLWIEADKNKDNWHCRDIPDPSDAQRLWIFECAPDFGNSLEVFGIYLLSFSIFLSVPPLLMLFVVLTKRFVDRVRSENS